MTKTEICNRALAVLGHDRTIADYSSDESTEALRCRQFYGSAVADCLSEHDWDFAAVEKNIGTMHPDPYGWVSVPVPQDAIRIILVSDQEGKPFKTRRNRDHLSVQTNGLPARIRYVTSDVTEADFPHKFTEGVIYQLAALLCGPMYGDDKKTEGYANQAKMKISDAITKETDETAYRGRFDNPFISARG